MSHKILGKGAQGASAVSRRTLMHSATLGAAGVMLGEGSAAAMAKSSGSVERRLRELGVVLPPAAAAVATYAPYRTVGELVYIAGQGPASLDDAKVFGKLGRDLTIEEGAHAARMTALSVLAQAKAACGGDLDRVVQWVQLTGYVNCTDDFKEQPKVVNGATDLLVDVFGEKGLPARAAIGVNALPFNIAIEVESVFQIRV